MNISENLLPVLVCAECNSYLSSPPVFVSSSGDGRSVCGRCTKPGAARNLTYEALAQNALFPCKFRAQGCNTNLPWNTAQAHEELCHFSDTNYENEEQPTIDIHENCCLCKKNIYVTPRYECAKGHKICIKCNARSNSRCGLCKSNMQNDPKYLCKYWALGCRMKDTKDVIMHHETDCDMRSYNCPFQVDDCKWSGGIHYMSRHLRSTHSNQIIEHHEVMRVFQMRDDSWVMIAHGEIFKCYVWVGESEVEWLAKYVGSQQRCCLYSCQVMLHSPSTRSIFRMTNRCHGWNNVSLEKCIKVTMKDLPKYLSDGRIHYKFVILKT